MSTNYYALADDGEKLHIGKQSNGWRFLFSTQTGYSIFTRDDWFNMIVSLSGDYSQQRMSVVNEYNVIQNAEQFFTNVNLNQSLKQHDGLMNYTDNDGYDFSLGGFS